jgi:hypothetical protein
MVREGMMEATAQMDGHTILKSDTSREQGTATAEHGGQPQLRREGHLKQETLRHREVVVLDLAEVLERVNPLEVVGLGRVRLDQVTLIEDAFSEESLPHQPVLVRREYVRSDVDLIVR